MKKNKRFWTTNKIQKNWCHPLFQPMKLKGRFIRSDEIHQTWWTWWNFIGIQGLNIGWKSLNSQLKKPHGTEKPSYSAHLLTVLTLKLPRLVRTWQYIRFKNIHPTKRIGHEKSMKSPWKDHIMVLSWTFLH